MSLLSILQGTLSEWYQVFLLAGMVNVLGGLVYLLAGKCDLQPWAVETEEMEEEEKRERLIEKDETC